MSLRRKSALTIRKRKAKVKISVKADGRGLLRFVGVRIPFTIAPQGLQGRPFDVVGLGENSVDLMAVVAEYPVSDTKQRLQRFARQSGGQIATALVACAKLGWKARYIGCFGEDEFGAYSRDSLTAEGVDTLTRGRELAASVTERLMAPLAGNEREQFQGLLRKLCAGLEPQARTKLLPPGC